MLRFCVNQTIHLGSISFRFIYELSSVRIIKHDTHKVNCYQNVNKSWYWKLKLFITLYTVSVS